MILYNNLIKHINYNDDTNNKSTKDLQYFFLGINFFHNHPYERNKGSHKEVFKIGNTSLLEYSSIRSKGEYIFLIIPSLINKSYILDLKKRLSLADYLAFKKINCYLIEWGEPDKNAILFNVENYILERIGPIIKFLYNLHKKKIILGGYCFGGVMALAAGKIFGRYVAKLALIATPWDFSFHKPINNINLLNTIINNNPLEIISPLLIQNAFNSINSEKIYRKFINFAHYNQKSIKAEDFVAVEKWINDGIHLTKKVALEFINDFYHQNILNNNKWKVKGTIINPSFQKKDTLIVMPIYDSIVPYRSSVSLAEKIPNKKVIKIRSGHIGMIIGKRAKKNFWIPLMKWIKE